MSFLDLLLLPENLTWAWRKAKRMYATGDNLYDQGELAAFDLDLEAQLASIWTEFRDGSYRPAPLRLLPQPKKPDDNGTPRMRQSFHVSVRDQVAWIAVVNAMGPMIDRLMPGWSYGHRLYRAAWYEDEANGSRSKLNIGPYRHSGGHMYRKFKHSWPLFRRHLCLTARTMATGKIEREELDEGEWQALRQAQDLPYLSRVNFWRRPKRDSSTLYHASLDLSKFYPKVSTEAILKGFDLCLPGFAKDVAMRALVARMLEFSVSAEGLSNELRLGVEPPTEEGPFGGIPTGLMAAGFLSNVAMLPVDDAVDAIVWERRNFAHFRFVDDHAVLAYDFDVLLAWINEYEGILAAHGIGAEIAEEKFDPKPLKSLIWPEKFQLPEAEFIALRNAIKKECQIDGAKPVKLMTRTLAQVSALAAADFDLLTDPDKRQRLEQLEWLLLADIPNREIRSDTRAAFAAGRIASMAPTLFDPDDALVDAKRQKSRLESLKPRSARDETELRRLTVRIAELSGKDEERRSSSKRHYFSLLFHAFVEHPDKVRLFIRLLDYCRATGYDGLKEVAEWMRQHASDDFMLLRRYLAALAMHVLARQLPQVAHDATNPMLLHFQRDAAKDHLKHVAALDANAFLATDGPQGRGSEFFVSDAAIALGVGLLVAATSLNDDTELASRLNRLAAKLHGPTWSAGSRAWRQATSRPVGVWTHWGETLAGATSQIPSPVWEAAAQFHDPSSLDDWNSLRRYPAHLPAAAWTAMAAMPERLAEDDAGWLLDAATAHPEGFALLAAKRRPAVRQVKQVMAAKPKGFLTLAEWVGATSRMEAHDPRAGEWTALEIVRQLLGPLIQFPATLDPIDQFHPATIGVPLAWLDQPPTEAGRPDIWTWEGWRHTAQTRPTVRSMGFGLRDYRFGAAPPSGGEDVFRRRLRIVGQILWWILRKDFTPPGEWNIRGQELVLTGVLGRDMEGLAVSSATVSILDACLLPRSAETSFMRLNPEMFGLDQGESPNDVSRDAPDIPSPNILYHCIVAAQNVLMHTQITVLRHQPRQLVPLHIEQVGLFAAPTDVDGFEGL